MADPAVYNDHREAADVGRRLKELEQPYKLAQEWKAARDDLEAARERRRPARARPRARGADDAARRGSSARAGPERPADSKDVIVEVRQGVGGDEAALWAGDVYRMLARYAERRGFKVEELAASPIDGGGYKEVTSRSRATAPTRSSSGRGHAPCAARPETESAGRSTPRPRPSP